MLARQIGKMLNGREPKIINGPEVLNKYVGQSEENIRNLFADAEKEYAERGDESELHIIIFDEIDANLDAAHRSSLAHMIERQVTEPEARSPPEPAEDGWTPRWRTAARGGPRRAAGDGEAAGGGRGRRQVRRRRRPVGAGAHRVRIPLTLVFLSRP